MENKLKRDKRIKINKEIMNSSLSNIDKLKKIKEIGVLDFINVFWVLKRTIIEQDKKITNLTIKLEDLMVTVYGDEKNR